jgi:hypothetical protein
MGIGDDGDAMPARTQTAAQAREGMNITVRSDTDEKQVQASASVRLPLPLSKCIGPGSQKPEAKEPVEGFFYWLQAREF